MSGAAVDRPWALPGAGEPPPPMPASLCGLWRRTRLAVPAEPPHTLDDTTTDVAWLQTPHWHADLRIPADRPAFDGVDGLGACTDAQLRALLRQEGFAGITTWDGAACTWHRVVDHAASLDVDAGRIDWRDGGLDERGVHASYVERWARDPGTEAGPFEARHDGAGRLAVRVGCWAIVLRPRALAAAETRRVRAAAARGEPVPRAALEAAADFEISLAHHAGGWTVVRSTLPWREGRAAWGDAERAGDDGLPAGWAPLATNPIGSPPR